MDHTIWRREPARIVEAVRALLLVATALGWVVLDDAQIAAIITAVSAVVSVVATEVVRAAVWSPASVEDLGVLDPDEDPTDPEAVAL